MDPQPSSPGGVADPGSLEARALRTLRSNVVRGYDPYYRTEFEYVRPSPGRYNWQWFWDSCFHVIALARLDPAMAAQEMRMLLAPQDPDGFIGHMTYWGRRGALANAVLLQSKLGTWRRRHSALIQPPFLGQALERLFDATGDAGLPAEFLPGVRRYYDWLAEHRSPPDTDLIAIFSPYEAGVDNSPAYDPLFGVTRPGRLRILYLNRRLDVLNIFAGGNHDARRLFEKDRFVVYDTLVNAAYAEGLRSVSRLHAALGDRAGAETAARRAAAVEAEVNDRCWDEGRGYYVHLAGRARRRLDTLTASSLVPLALETTPRDRVRQVVERHLTNPDEFWTKLPVPSVAACEPTFDPSGERMIWRGPVCMNLNWMLVRGLRRHGHDAEAAHIAARSRAAVDAGGFREFYDPVTGRGLRGTAFGWATVVVDM